MISLEFFVNACRDIYKRNLTIDIAGTNMYYAARDIRSSQIIFSNGANDPWHVLGVLRNLGATMPALLIEGTAHCSDLYPSRTSDLPSLKSARQYEWSVLDSWLKL